MANHHLPLQLQTLSLHMGKQMCLSAIDCTINTRGITVVMGTNGAGKTLLLKTIAGLHKPNSGQLIWQQPPQPPMISWVPSTARLLNRSVANNLLHVLRHHRHSHPEKHCQDALAWANIEHLYNRQANDLSTGEQQLVALARAWALKPHLLLLDEPTANLDPQRQQQLNQLIRDMSLECKVILTTHQIRQARELAEDILLLENGKLLVHLPAEDFFTSSQFQRFSGIQS